MHGRKKTKQTDEERAIAASKVRLHYSRSTAIGSRRRFFGQVEAYRKLSSQLLEARRVTSSDAAAAIAQVLVLLFNLASFPRKNAEGE